MTQNFLDNTLYEMDNLVVLRGMNSETVDLIATDPPFNTKRNRSTTAGHYVDNWKWGDTGILPDQWKWNEVHPKWLEEIKDNHNALYYAIDAAKHCQGEDTAAFLCFLSVRLLEMHRILKPTGSIYLHCDPTASHYIKTCMDAIFGKQNFRNEIVWYYGGPRAIKTAFPRKHDIIFFYSKMSSYPFNQQRGELPSYLYERARKDIDGRLWVDQNLGKLTEETIKKMRKEGRIFETKTGGLRRKQYLDEMEGSQINDVWNISILNSQSNERTGSPDQKPLALYERIIKASSNKDDLVLDPFCGCATTIIAAKNLNRRWIGIDRRKDARYHIITRLMGIDRKERKRLEEYATDKEWLDKQMQSYEMHYQTEPPKRTDEEKQTSPKLDNVYSTEPENPLTHAEMHEILVNQFGLKCWGCNFIPPDKRYLHLDHIIPKTDGGTNHIDNRALLCQPCNTKKSNTMSLTALRRENKREEYMQPHPPIDLQAALAWTKNYSIRIIRETEYQLKFDYSKS